MSVSVREADENGALTDEMPSLLSIPSKEHTVFRQRSVAAMLQTGHILVHRCKTVQTCPHSLSSGGKR